ncbi:MAG: hypothetical protein E7466_05335 [Ruminococcaceae bacterium]|nr:hypothetical protein [Oscillospiraceae bacterium]
MTCEFEYLMHLLGAAATGTTPQPPKKPICWERIFALAKEQHIVPLIALACQRSDALGCPADLLQQQTKTLLSRVLSERVRRGFMVDILSKMEQAGIRSYMVKGAVAARNYAAPEYRISSDTDICIDPAQEEEACRWLHNYGFSVTPRWRNGHHSVARYPRMGALEVHIRLYDEIAQDVWFKAIPESTLLAEPLQDIVTSDGIFHTLGPTDHLIFMALHMIKHFISSGMSLRMMMDVALHFIKNKDSLDTDRFWSVIESLHYTPLMRGILWATITYCGLSAEDFPGLAPCPQEHIQRILSDIEEGGWLGHNDMEQRAQSGLDYNRELMLRQLSPWRYRIYLFKWRHGLSLRTFFPKREQLLPRYPWLQRHKWLLPAAWFHRLIFHGRTAIKKESKVDNAATSPRLELFRSLEML